MKIKNTELTIIEGDITKMECDVIVNPAHNTLKMEAGLAGVIKKKAGDKIEQEAMEKGPVNVGEAVWTSAGKLKANYIIHAVTGSDEMKPNEATIRQACANALRCAHDLKAKGIAFPGLGCGVGGFSVTGSAKIMAQEFLRFVKSHDKTMKTIILCLHDDETFRAFEQTVSGYVHHIQDDLGEGPYVTVDVIIELKEGVVIIERSNPPYGLALPGGFVDEGESLEQAVCREAKEETDMELEDLRQFHAYSDPKRDPRFHTVTVVFIAKGKGKPKSGDDAKAVRIVKYDDLLKGDYAFDHKQILRDYLKSRGSDKK
jgi:O-acetyl-ADP-ribose deacetylase (regulator of RNase III)/ADP-ribose pyrophosphatase YjhB (NUDIX family)